MSSEFSQQYKTALEAGYSPEDISSFLSNSSPQYQSALAAGYSPKEIENFLTKKKKTSSARSLVSAFPKGAVKETREQLQKTLEFLPRIFGLLPEEEEAPPISSEEFEEKIEEFLPTNEGYAERALERGGRIFPYAALGGGNIGIQGLRSAAAGALGEGAKELGFGSLGQTLAELPALGIPGLGKKIQPTTAQKDLVEGARKLGLKEKEIAPLIQSETKGRILGKVSPRRGRTRRVLDRSYKALGEVYDRLEAQPEATQLLSEAASTKVIDSIAAQLKEFPAGLRKNILEDFADLQANPVSGSSLINFYKDVNYYIKKGFKQLGILKDPIFKALEDISPELAEDFRLTNKLYSKYYEISDRLKPSLVSDLFTAGESIRLLTGVALGNYPLLMEAVGETGGRLLAREMLLNPRFQNLGKKVMNAVTAKDFKTADRLGNKLLEMIKEEIPDKTKKFSPIEFKKAINSKKA